jgi:hypothetical protein
MEKVLNRFQFVVITPAGWMNQGQQNVIEYLCEENRVATFARTAEQIRLPFQSQPD